MLINKVFDTCIDLLDPNEIYTADIEALLLDKLSKRYIKKCYQSIYILGINRIINRSSIRMADDRLDGGAYVNVQFEVSGVVLIRGEILHGCKIIEIHASAITAEHEYVGLLIQKDPSGLAFSMLSVGQRIPVVIQKVKYNPNHTSISATAIPYVPNWSTSPAVYYNVSSGLNPQETDKIDYILNEIKTELTKHEKIADAKSYGFFRDLLHGYKSNQRYENSKIANTLKLKPVKFELKSILELDSGIAVYPNEDHKHNGRFFWGNSSDNLDALGSEIMIINSSLYPILADAMHKYLLYLIALRGFMQEYSEPKAFESLMTYWQICKKQQL